MGVMPGSRIGRYRIESRLGGGAMGVVYLARDERLERRVALKLISPSLAADPDFRARFEREARAAAALDHPHLLPVYEAGEDDEQLYLAMRYVPGVDLATRLARHGPLDLAATSRLVTQLAAALDAAHAVGLIHRDVKPANVLLGPDEHAYLADFGLARSAGAGITRPGQLVGTADYTAPELLAGAPASAASDIYALACLAVECLTGRPPFSRDGELATLYAHANEPVPDLASQLPELPAGLQGVIARGLAKDPMHRFPSASSFADALRVAADIVRSESTTSRPEPSPARGKMVPLRPTMLAASGVAVVALAAAAWVATRGDDQLSSTLPSGPPTSEEASRTGASDGAGSTPEVLAVPTLPPASEDGPTLEDWQPVALREDTTYALVAFRPSLSFTPATDDWTAAVDEPDGFELRWEPEDAIAGYLAGALIQVVYEDPCPFTRSSLEEPRPSATRVLPDTPGALVEWLQAHPNLQTTSPFPTSVGGYVGLQIDVSVGTAPECPEVADEPALERAVSLFPVGRTSFLLAQDEEVRIVVVDVDGRPATFLIGTIGPPRFDDVTSAAQPLIESIRFSP